MAKILLKSIEKRSMLTTLLFGLTFVLVSSMDIYVPIAPQLAAFFNVSESLIKCTFLLGPFASLLVGIITGLMSDRYGRKPIVAVSVACYLIGTLFCMLAPTYDVFFMARFVQSLGVGSLLVLITAILADMHSGPTLARTLSVFALLFPSAFAVSPIVGAQVYMLLGWQWVFGVLLIGVVPLAFMLLWQLPETCKGQKTEKMLQELKSIAKSKRSMALAMLHGLPITIGLLFTVNGVFLYQAVYEYDVVAFSYIQAIPVACQCLGALIYRSIIRFIGLKLALHVGLYITLFFITLCFMTIVKCIEGPIVTVLTVSSFTIGASFLITTAATLLLDEQKESKGLATSFLSLMRNFGIVIVVLLASFLPHRSSIPTISTMLVVALVLCVLIPIVLATQTKEDCSII